MLKEYVHHKLTSVLYVIGIMAFASIFLWLTGTNIQFLFLMNLTILLLSACRLLIGFYGYRKRSLRIRDILAYLDKRYLITELLTRPSNPEAALYYDILKYASVDMITDIADAREEYLGYREYLEEWIHEMKTPLTTISMLNPKSENYDRKLGTEYRKLTDLLETNLYYIRSNTLEKDYQVKEISLADLIHKTVLKEKERILLKHITLTVECDGRAIVYSDEKWILFILHQLAINAIQYTEDHGIIDISVQENDGKLQLTITDNGCGIRASDLPRIFEKGYTGQSGKRSKASGIGLYLCKKSADKMGIGLYAASVVGEYTRMTMIFPKEMFHREVTENLSNHIKPFDLHLTIKSK